MPLFGLRSATAVIIALFVLAGCDGGGGGEIDAASSEIDGGGDGDAGAGDTRPSAGCAAGGTAYPAGSTTVGEIVAGGMTRTFRVHVPPRYDGRAPLPLVLMLHGGGGSGRQLETASSRMSPIADREGFIAVYPDGTGARLRTWNAGGCCGSAVTNDVDDVGFVRALIDHLEAELCVDRRREFASGMSNGGLMSHRLACELSDRIAAVAPVAGTEMSPTCTPARPVAVMHIHGSDDGHVPWDGGEGCGLAGVSFTSVPATMERRRTLNGCDATTTEVLAEGDGRCDGWDGCDEGADVVLCTVSGGGHSWPGGEPSADVVDCPADGEQSTTFVASEIIWRFFATHPMPL